MPLSLYGQHSTKRLWQDWRVGGACEWPFLVMDRQKMLFSLCEWVSEYMIVFTQLMNVMGLKTVLTVLGQFHCLIMKHKTITWRWQFSSLHFKLKEPSHQVGTVKSLLAPVLRLLLARQTGASSSSYGLLWQWCIVRLWNVKQQTCISASQIHGHSPWEPRIRVLIFTNFYLFS